MKNPCNRLILQYFNTTENPKEPNIFNLSLALCGELRGFALLEFGILGIGLRRKSSEKDLDMALDSSGKLQRGPQRAQVSVPPLVVRMFRMPPSIKTHAVQLGSMC